MFSCLEFEGHKIFLDKCIQRTDVQEKGNPSLRALLPRQWWKRGASKITKRAFLEGTILSAVDFTTAGFYQKEKLFSQHCRNFWMVITCSS